jgi:hypothetical protein
MFRAKRAGFIQEEQTMTKLYLVSTAVFPCLLAFSPVAESQGVRTKPPPAGTAVPVAPGPLQTKPMPDLVIVSVTGVPDEITGTEGFDSIFFATVTVQNVGNADAWFAPGSWIIGGPSQYTNISASKITNQQTTYNTAIKPGETRTETLAGKIKCFRSDPLEVEFQVDPQNKVAESNERNNSWKKLVANRAVPGRDQKPDLVVESVTFKPLNPTRYDRVFVDVQMRNLGPGPAIFCEQDRIWMSIVEQPDRPSSRAGGGGAGDRVVKAGEQFFGGVYIVEPNTLQKGCYRVRVTVDDKNVIPEISEGNNTKTAYLAIDGGDCSKLIQEDRMLIRQVEKVVPQTLPSNTKPLR